MRKKLITLMLLCTVSYVHAQTLPQKNAPAYENREAKREALWKDFHKARVERFGQSQDIKIYAENDSLSRLCFICDKGLYIFRWNKSEGEIENIQHAKAIMYDKINRITFEHKTEEDLGFFFLWYYETEELRVGSQ